MPDWRSRWRVRSGLGQRPPSPGPEGCDLGGGAAHVARPLDRRPAEQGRARRDGAAAAGWLDARWRRSGGEGPGSGGAGADRPGLRQLPGAGLGGQSAPLLPGTRAHGAAARPVRRGHLADAADGMISAILKNPAYAGAFVYGRTRSCRATYASGKLIIARCPMAEWKIVVKNRYPAYVGWEDFERL